jgi:hypothetical protein
MDDLMSPQICIVGQARHMADDILYSLPLSLGAMSVL